MLTPSLKALHGLVAALAFSVPPNVLISKGAPLVLWPPLWGGSNWGEVLAVPLPGLGVTCGRSQLEPFLGRGGNWGRSQLDLCLGWGNQGEVSPWNPDGYSRTGRLVLVGAEDRPPQPAQVWVTHRCAVLGT